MPIRNLPLRTLALGTILALAGCVEPKSTNVGAPGAPSSAPSQALEAVPMVSHIAFGVFEQDVYIERATEPGKVFRPTPADAGSAVTKDAPLFAAATRTPHDPTFSNAGPFDKGAALGFGLGDWLAATGSAAYLCTDGTTARIDATFSKLVPEGVYTFWNARLDFKDGAIVGGQDIPAGAPDGSQSVFRAGAEGNARFSVAFNGCNEAATGGPGVGPTGSARVFAIAFHSDGRTYGGDPGPFGQASHVQLFGFVRADAAA